MYRKHIYCKFIILLNTIVLLNNSLAYYINKENIQIDTNSRESSSLLNKREVNVISNETKNCNTNSDCDNNSICFNKICYINYNNKECNIVDNKDSCPKPFYCKDNVCHLRYDGKYITDSNEGSNFLLSDIGKICIFFFIVFLIIVFFAVFHLATKYNIHTQKMNKEQFKNSQQKTSNPPNMLNPAEERNLYIQSIKEKRESKTINQNEDIYNKDAILNNLKTNDPYTTVNTKKDFDVAGNTYPKTPQSGSTLINKSFSSTNNLIDKNRFSERSSIQNSYYRKYSAGGFSSIKDPSIYNTSFQDFNTSNSLTYLYPSENKAYISPYNISSNTLSSSPISPSSTRHQQSLSLSLPKKSHFESPVLRGNYCHRTYASTSNQIPFILEDNEDDVDDNDEDNQTTLSFDSGVLKVSSSSFKNKESIILSYSEDLNASKECIIASPKTPTSSKRIYG